MWILLVRSPRKLSSMFLVIRQHISCLNAGSDEVHAVSSDEETSVDSRVARIRRWNDPDDEPSGGDGNFMPGKTGD